MRRPYAGRVGVLALVALVGCGPAHAETRMLPSPGAAVVSTDPAGAANAATSIVAVPAPLPTITTTTVAPDPVSARCPICPPVQPDPAQPVVTHVAARPAPVLSSVKTADPVIFITIDDGETWNEDAAQLLEVARVPVTLFLTETYIADKISSMRRLVDAGAWVEGHTSSHPNLLRGKNNEVEVCGPLDRYEVSFGRRPSLFRPPYGTQNAITQTVAGMCGMHAVVLWRASMNYGALATQGGDLRGGDIVLMHFRPDLADNLTELFRIVNEQGLRIGRLECYVGGDPHCGQPWR